MAAIIEWARLGVRDTNDTQLIAPRPPVNDIDRLYLLHDLGTIPGALVANILNHLRLFPGTIGALGDLLETSNKA